jgi:Leucine-rich repeat (LRR) protein
MKRIISVLLLFVVGLEAIDLQCKFEDRNFGLISGTCCTVSNLNITNQQTIRSVNGQSNFDGSNYEIVDIYDEVVQFFPQGLKKFFSHIKGLSISRSKLKKVEKKDLEQFPKIRFLSLNGNEIRFLPNDLFEGNLELELISFRWNPISHIGHNLVIPLKGLVKADFYLTKCPNFDYYLPTMSSFVADLKENCPEPTQEMIDCDTECDILFSPSNRLIDIKCKMTEETCDVIDLVVDVFGSEIAKVQDENGAEIESVTKIRIVDQVMPILPTNLAEKFPELTEISIERSGFFMFDDNTFSKLTLLTSLTLSNNKIIDINGNAFAHNEKLTTLNLSGNKLLIIGFEAFDGLKNLIELNLSHNQLIVFFYGAFDDSLNQLAHIDLSRKFLFFMLSTRFI